MVRLVALVCLLCPLVLAEVYFKETFDEAWTDRWVQSENKKSSGEAGDFELSAGKFYNDAEADQGIQTSQDAKFYFYSSKLEKSFDSVDKKLVVQFSVKHEQQIDCGGGYIKLLPEGLDQKQFDGESAYNIMFGPDICGSTRKVHVIFNHDGTNHLISENIPCESDKFTHIYTLILDPKEGTFEVKIDGESKKTGKLEDNWKYEEPKKINDPEQSKPEDWVDEAMIDDPEDVKPEDWDSEPEEIVDPDATQPEDWDEEFDGEWEAPMIRNEKYKGKWSPKRIDNPEYKGEWEHPQIDNPDYVKIEDFAQFKSNAYVGFDLWQVKSGTIFDNIFIGNSEEEATAFFEETFPATKEGEKKMHEEQEAARRAEEEAEAEKLKSDEDEDDDEDDDEDEVPFPAHDEETAEESESTHEEL